MATIRPTSVPTKRLASAITSGATSFQLTDILGWDGVALTSGSFGTKAYGVFRDPTNTNIELFEFDPSTIASSSITILLRGLKFDGDLTTEVSGNKRSWTKGTLVELGTHVPQLFRNYVDTLEAQTIAGVKTFSSLPATTAGNPVADNDLVRKAYADSLALGGATVNRIVVAGNAGATVSAGQLVYLDVADGEWKLCDADTAATVDNIILGIAQGAGTDGNAISNGVLLSGLDLNQTGLTNNTVYYASNTAGGISSSVGTNEVTVGVSRSTTTLLFNPRYNQQITENQQDALVGSSGTPSASNTYVTTDDVSSAAASGKIVRATGTALPALDASNLTNLAFSTSVVRGETINGATTPVPVVLIDDTFQEEFGASNIDFGRVTTGNKCAVGFKLQGALTLTTLKIYLRKQGSPTDNVQVRIETDTAGAPSGSVVTNGSANNISGSGLTTSYVLTTATFGSTVTLAANTQYWLVLQRDSTTSDTNYYQIDGISSSNIYASFTGLTYNASAWSSGNLGYFQLIAATGSSVSAWRCDANHANYHMRFFRGFVKTDGAINTTASVISNGIVTGFTGLTPLEDYYVSNTIGTLGTTSGDTESYVGRAISATAIDMNGAFGKAQYIGTVGLSGGANTLAWSFQKARFAVITANVAVTGGATSTMTYTVFRVGGNNLAVVDTQNIGGTLQASITINWSSATNITVSAADTLSSCSAYFYR